MRHRDRILSSLESAYREAFEKARQKGDADEMSRLDFQFQRDQIRMEVLLDIRELLGEAEEPAPREEGSIVEKGTAFVEKAQALRRMTKLR